MFLEQIEKKQRKQMEDMKNGGPKVAVVPSSQLDPAKGLNASAYVPGAPDRRAAKTLALKPEAEVHDRLTAVGAKMGIKSKKEVARRAMLIGLAHLEDVHRVPR